MIFTSPQTLPRWPKRQVPKKNLHTKDWTHKAMANMLYNASGPPRRPFLMTEDFSIGQSRCSGCLNDAFRCDPSSNKFVAHRFDTKHAHFQANSDFTKVAETRAMCFSGANCGRKPNRATQNTIQRAYKGGPHAAEPTNQKPSLLQPKKHGPNSPNCPFASPACPLPSVPGAAVRLASASDLPARATSPTNDQAT